MPICSIWLCTLGHADNVNILVPGSSKNIKMRSHGVAFATMLWSLVCFAFSPCFLLKAIGLKATIMLCFQVRIFLFVLTLFNILRSFLVTVVYRFQDKGKTLGLCSAHVIEVFTSTGVSGLRNLLKKERFRAPKNFTFNNNFDTT